MAEVKKSSTKSGFIPYDAKGFVISKPLTANDAGNCTWGFAEKFNKSFFLKRFLTPKFPDPDADIYESTRARMVAECEKWYNTHAKVYKAVLECGGSNIVNPIDFFMDKNAYYLVTERIESCGVKFTDIYTKSNEQKRVIMKILAYEISRLASKNVIHSDLKPENLILKKTVGDFFTVKIIDFDASFLQDEPPEPDDLTGDQVYFSPEMIIYMATEEGEITPKSDVFALGILFHIILCGKQPKFSEGYFCLGEAVASGSQPVLYFDLDNDMEALIQDMLCADPEKRPSADEVFRRLGGVVPEKKSAARKSAPKAVEVKKSADSTGQAVKKGGLVINMKKSSGGK